jgi:hypothetical protein
VFTSSTKGLTKHITLGPYFISGRTCKRIFMIFLSFPRQMSKTVPWTRPWQSPFPIHYSLTTLPHHTIQPEPLRMSLNKPNINKYLHQYQQCCFQWYYGAPPV